MKLYKYLDVKLPKSTETLHQQQIPIIEQIRPLSYDDNLAELNCGEIASGLLEAKILTNTGTSFFKNDPSHKHVTVTCTT